MKDLVVLPTQTVNQVIDYLARRPWIEANDLLNLLLKREDLELYLASKAQSEEKAG